MFSRTRCRATGKFGPRRTARRRAASLRSKHTRIGRLRAANTRHGTAPSAQPALLSFVQSIGVGVAQRCAAQVLSGLIFIIYFMLCGSVDPYYMLIPDLEQAKTYCVYLYHLPAGLLQLDLGGSTQGINNAAKTSTECRRQTNQVSLSARPHLVDNSRPSLAPSEVQDYIQAVSDDACSPEPSMAWIHRRAAHHDVFCYFTFQTAIGFQQSLRSSSDSTKVCR